MTRMNKLSSLGLALVAAGCFALPAAAQTTAATGNAENGERLFMANLCYTCHGTRGANGGIAGPTIAPTGHTLTSFMRQLRRPALRMPPYTEAVLSDAEAADIYAYLKSIPRPKPPEQIPALSR
jgi:mono/diheme cytochrome c family protein